jgi:acetyl/propionyl-CoA carboxylase alpha subunit
MLKAINDYTIEGVETTLPFGHFVCTHPDFVSGHFNTSFIGTHYTKEIAGSLHEKEAKLAARLALYQYLEDAKILRLPTT